MPRGGDPGSYPIDPCVLATQLAPDGVVAYHAALQFHGKAYSLWSRFRYLTQGRHRRFIFRDQEIVPAQAPAAPRDLSDLGGGIGERPHAGGVVRVATLERSLVDVPDAPERNGGWKEVWRSLEMVEYFDLDAVLAYTRVLGSALTAARVGFFLEQHRDAFRGLGPAQPRTWIPAANPANS